MQVKKFEAPTIQEALDNVKRELGPEAIILQTRKNKRGFGLLSKASVEVTAAISERSLNKKQVVESRIPESSRSLVRGLPAGRQADMIEKYSDRTQSVQKAKTDEAAAKPRKITATRYIDIQDTGGTQAVASGAVSTKAFSPTRGMSLDGGMDLHEPAKPPRNDPSKLSLEDEVQTLKKIIDDLRTAKSEDSVVASGRMGSTPELELPVFQDAFEQLLLHGVDRRSAFTLMKKVAFELGGESQGYAIQADDVLDCLASEMMNSIQVQGIFEVLQDTKLRTGPLVVAFAGPTGMGKTSTVAKLASEALLRRKLKVGLINLDSQKPGAFDQLGTYAKLLNSPFRSASSQADFAAALKDFQGVDVVLVDTSGLSQKNAESHNKTIQILKSLPDLKLYMVLSATTREAELYDAVTRFSELRPQGVVLSKLDEATIYGPIYNISQKVKLPLAYFTTGQKIPEDIELATAERVVSLVMDL